MNDHDQHANAQPPDEGSISPPNTDGYAEPVPSRVRSAVGDIRDRLSADDERDIVAEYEDRYYGVPQHLDDPPEDTGSRRVRLPRAFSHTKRKHNLVALDDNERKWAALAHASTLLAALAALFSGGALVMVTMFVPLFIYFSFRKRSEYVAFHALQAFTLQLLGTIGWMTLVVVGTLVSVALLIIAAILIVALIGLVLLPLVIVTYILFLLASLALPIGMVIYSVIALTETYSGHDYRIPYVGRWVESQMYSHDSSNA